MPAPAARYEILPARGLKANLDAAIADIAENELCYATDEEVLYIKTGGVLVATGGSGSVSYGATPPAEPEQGDLWYDTNDARLFVYTGTEWADASPDAGNPTVITSDSAPGSPQDGDLWFRTTDGRMYVYYDDGASSQWVDANPSGSVDIPDGSVTPAKLDREYLTDAPSDGSTYARNNGAWSSITASGGDINNITYAGADAWGSIDSGGTLVGGFNIQSTTRTSVGTYDVVFTTPMPNANYSVTTGSASSMQQALNLTANGFTLKVRATDGTTADNPSYFAVHAANAITPPSGVGADAWGDVAFNGDLSQGYNIASVSNTEAGAYVISFTTPMPTANYAVSISPENSNFTFGVDSQTTNSFRAVFRNQGSSGALSNGNFSFTVHSSSSVTPTYTWRRSGTTVSTANDGDTVAVKNTAGNTTFSADSTTGIVKVGDHTAAAPSYNPDNALIVTHNDTGGARIRLRNTVSVTNTNSDTIVVGNEGASRNLEIGLYQNSNATLSGQPAGYLTLNPYNGVFQAYWTDSNGNLRASSVRGNIGLQQGTIIGTQTSDQRVKQNIADCPYGLSEVKQLQPRTFEYITAPGVSHAGFIAQEVRDIIPEAVYDTNDPIEGEAEAKLAMDYVELIPALVNAIKEQQTQIEALEARLSTLEGN